MPKTAKMGRVYDLESLYSRLNRLYFDGSLDLQVRWSKRSAVKAKAHVVLGYYSPRTKTITMSQRLDNLRVPLYFLEHVLFHEMLHAVFPSEKHRMHSEKFKRYERLHPDYDRAVEWEKANLKILFEASQKSLFSPAATGS